MNQSPASLDSPPPAPAQVSHAGALPAGTLFAGRYRIVRCLGVGGMGSIYEVVHVETNRRRALKIMHPHLFQSDEMRERFKREARIAADVESEYIVDVSDAGVDEVTRTPFLVMELLQGEELGHRLRRLGHLPPTEVMAYLHQVALALDKTHAKMIVHRDLKPENLFLTLRDDGSPRVKILDFGVAKLVREGATNAGATRSLGTPLYMAPEQFRTSGGLTPAADIHALGMMVYTLLVGEPYWNREANASEDVIAFAMAVIRGPQESAVRRAAARGVLLPPAFDVWFARMTAPNAADRFQRATEAVRALGEVLGVAPGERPLLMPMPSTPPEPALRPAAITPPGSPAAGDRPAHFSPVSPAVPGVAPGPVVLAAMLPDPAVATSGPGTTLPQHATTSAGVSLEPTRPVPARRAALVIGLSALLGAAVFGAGGWLLLRSRSDDSAGSSTAGTAVTASTDTGAQTGTLSEPTVAPVPTETASRSAEDSTPPATAARPPQTGTLPATAPTPKPTTAPSATAKPATTVTKPGTRPTATAAAPATSPTATKPPLIGRD